MQLKYSLEIENPDHHYLRVIITGEVPRGKKSLSFYIPSWSPGSYLMREYGKNIRGLRALDQKGRFLKNKQVDKGTYLVEFVDEESFEFQIEYDVYCHEISVRTSYIDSDHAFIHGPSVLMGVLGEELVDPVLTVKFPALWSKISTGLRDISTRREEFVYTAKNYDELIDSPLEIGCHESDGFTLSGVDHELAFFGATYPHKNNLKKDITTICEEVIATFKGDIPFEKYTFITHFLPGIFGGLEHLNSTALQFSSHRLTDRKGYLLWLELVAHEYFHAWNVKRIRPKELGPFNYLEEAKTRMHWLTEGLTSFMDQLFIYRAGLSTLEEYLEAQKSNINSYLNVPGRKFHSLEESSFNAWIKLYRPDENSNNSSISYYLKGGIVFFILHVLFVEDKKSIDDLLKLLWVSYKKRPEEGLLACEVFSMVEKIGGKKTLDKFETMIQTCEELDFELYFKKIGIEVVYDDTEKEKADFGATFEFKADRVVVKSVGLDGPAFKSGLNAGDELISVNGMRVLRVDFEDFKKSLMQDTRYDFLIARNKLIKKIPILMGKPALHVKDLKVVDEKLAKQALLRK